MNTTRFLHTLVTVMPTLSAVLE